MWKQQLQYFFLYKYSFVNLYLRSFEDKERIVIQWLKKVTARILKTQPNIQILSPSKELCQKTREL